ncbi:MAG TPA: hypothetical protein PLF79_12395 [Thauera sp.]|uniref:hypothetical protein n=1 Tax=Thauera sp. TaxID=1905334 RepID=UPI002BBADDF6|nr:hypothetical protein [Thauera sp.]HRP26557.1 hypothetical protein [Thauera sp.]HRP66870.1 hypothetical protein [Thauera sp.]
MVLAVSCGVGVLLLAAPIQAHAQAGRQVEMEQAEAAAGKVSAETRRKEWRRTLGGGAEIRDGASERRRMSDEERSRLRRHVSDAARGAYGDEAPRGKGRR